MQPDSHLVTKTVASPNHGERHLPLDSVILHYTGMPNGEGALKRLCLPEAEVSCHYLIWENGDIFQLVPESRRAWHAGKSHWAGKTDMNSASIGIEIVSPGHTLNAEGVETQPPYPQAQIATTIALCKDICRRNAIKRQHVLGHSDIAPGRKIDPGELFPWAELARNGVGHWVNPAPIRDGNLLEKGSIGPPVMALQHMLARYGYGVEVNGLYDDRLETVVNAFQRHFRPAKIDGIADASTIETLKDVLAALPH